MDKDLQEELLKSVDALLQRWEELWATATGVHVEGPVIVAGHTWNPMCLAVTRVERARAALPQNRR